MSKNQALKSSYLFAWGKDLSGWLDMYGQNGAGIKTFVNLIWLLFAFVVMKNVFLAIVKDVRKGVKG
jgi:hypothetical protein